MSANTQTHTHTCHTHTHALTHLLTHIPTTTTHTLPSPTRAAAPPSTLASTLASAEGSAAEKPANGEIDPAIESFKALIAAQDAKERELLEEVARRLRAALALRPDYAPSREAARQLGL